MSNEKNNKKIYEDTFYIVPRRISKLPGMTLAYLNVYESIFQFWNKSLPCFLSTPALQERTGASERQVYNALTFFEKNGEMKRIQKGLKRYLIQSDKKIEIDEKLYKGAVECSIDKNITTPALYCTPPLHSTAPHPCTRVHTEYKEGEYKEVNTTNSESIDSPAPASTSTSKKVKRKTPELLRELINVYCEVFPDNPQPHPTVISTTLDKVLSSLVTRWPELANGKPVTAAGFRVYLEALKRDAPGFSLNEYTTVSGRIKKNGLDTFARWDTMVKFSEGAYS